MANDVRRIDPSDLDVTANDDGTFTLVFSEYLGGGRRREFKITLKDWWIGHVVAHLRDVVNKRAAEVKRLANCFTEGE